MNARDYAIAIADGGPIKRSGDEWVVRCPAHNDKTPSLAIREGDNGTPLFHCFAGCLPDDILAARGFTWNNVLTDENSWLPEEAHEIVYKYTDEQGHPLFEVVRGPNKRFRQRTYDRDQLSGFRWNLAGIRRVLYRLPEVIDAVNGGQEVWITEGEKDAEVLRARHVCATTNPGGAGKMKPEYLAPIMDGQVTIWADADEPGRVHAREVRETLVAQGNRVRIVESAHGKDAHDHLFHGLTLDDVLVTVPYDGPEQEALFLRADAYIDQDFDAGRWVVPFMLRQREVTILTGFEGFGKSSLMKQMAVCAAIGFHPFDLAPVGPPVTVLYIDCENPRADCIEDFTRLRTAALAEPEAKWDDPALFIHDRPQMNVANASDLAWLVERVHAHQPDLLLIGPVYGLVETDIAKEETARALKRAVTAIHQVCPCAVILEHHTPHAAPGEERRTRPIGSSLLLRWPSFGFGLRPVGDSQTEPFEFEAWRGSRRRGRSWPERVRQVDGWFWRRCQPGD